MLDIARDNADDYDSDLDDNDPFRNVRSVNDNGNKRDLSSELLSVLPGQIYSLDDRILSLRFSPTDSSKYEVSVNLFLDAASGCGGIVWPAGQV